jgi:galactokinase
MKDGKAGQMSEKEISLQAENGLVGSSFAAPARVNLIGEHTDYTGGYVLPFAISFKTTAEVMPADEGYRLTSTMFESERTMGAGDRTAKIGEWSDYPVGVLRQLQARRIEPPPFTLKLSGNVPLGAGLSSSASVEVATAVALLALAGRELPAAEIARLCQRAENDYVGSPCGIMDQFVVTAGQADHALLLHTGKLTYELLPMNLGTMANYCIVVANSEVRHSIADGDYGLRRREVEAGQAVLVKAFPGVKDLGEATLAQLAHCEDAMPRASFLRCRHIIGENARVLEAKAALLSGDAARMGKLMTLAHASERDDFACSVAEIDFLVDKANELEGCLGSRLTGGGFGGCTVNLVHVDKAESFRAALMAAYFDAFGITGETYLCRAVDGALQLALKNARTAGAVSGGSK